MDQVIQVLGSLLILGAFLAAQRGWLSTDSRLYLSLNLVGAAVLAVLAAYERQLGFLLLEFCLALIAGQSLLRTVRCRQPHHVAAVESVRGQQLLLAARPRREPQLRLVAAVLGAEPGEWRGRRRVLLARARDRRREGVLLLLRQVRHHERVEDHAHRSFGQRGQLA